MDWVASPKLFFGVRGGYYMSDINDTQRDRRDPRIIFSTGNNTAVSARLSFRQSPAASASNGFSQHPDELRRSTRDQQTRAYFQADGTVYASMGGEHQLKFGVQADRVGNDVLSGRSRATWCACAGTRRSRPACPYARHLRLLPGPQQRRRPEEGLHHRRQHPHDEHRPVHPGRLDDQQPADDQCRHPHRA